MVNISLQTFTKKAMMALTITGQCGQGRPRDGVRDVSKQDQDGLS